MGAGQGEGRGENVDARLEQCGMRAPDEERVPVFGAPALVTGTSPLVTTMSPLYVSASPIDMSVRRRPSTARAQSDPQDGTRSCSPLSDRLHDDSLPDVFSESSYSGNSEDDDEDDAGCTEYTDDVEVETYVDLTCRETLTPRHGDRNKLNPQSVTPRQNISSISNNGTSVFIFEPGLN